MIVESYKYDAWGRVLGVYDQNGAPLTESAVGNRILWQGREYSWKTGLYYFRARWYDPITGRWLSNDPIGISGGLNQYVFCGNNPVNCRDPLGLRIVVLGSDEYKQKVMADLDQLKGTDHRLSNLVRGLELSDNTHIIQMPKRTPWNKTVRDPRRGGGEFGGFSSVVFYDPDNCENAKGDSRDPAAGLAHELSHARDFDLDIGLKGNFWFGVPKEEVFAIRYENLVRQSVGNDTRTTFGDITISYPYYIFQ